MELRSLASVLVPAAAFLAARQMIPEPSEWFWVVVPIGVGAWLLATRSTDELRRAAIGSAGVFGAAFVAALGYQLASLRRMPAPASAADLGECAIDAWFGLALVQAAVGGWWVVRSLVWSWHTRRGGRPDALLPQVLPALLAFPVVAPVLVGSALVHRPKVPDALLPDRPFEEVTLAAADGLEIHGWFLPAPGGSARTVLMEHGIGANRSLTLPMLIVGQRLHANTLMLDLRGHGESAGHTTSFGCREGMDVEAGLRWLRVERPDQARQIVAVGLSLSTAATVFAAARADPPFDAVVLDSAFTAPIELVDNVLRWVPSPLRPLLSLPGVPLASLETRCWLPDVRPVDAIAHLRAPVWIAHADGDPLIPVEQGRRMLAAAAEPKAWFEAHGATHLACNADPAGWLASMQAFLDRELPAP